MFFIETLPNNLKSLLFISLRIFCFVLFYAFSLTLSQILMRLFSFALCRYFYLNSITLYWCVCVCVIQYVLKRTHIKRANGKQRTRIRRISATIKRRGLLSVPLFYVCLFKKKGRGVGTTLMFILKDFLLHVLISPVSTSFGLIAFYYYPLLSASRISPWFGSFHIFVRLRFSLSNWRRIR